MFRKFVSFLGYIFLQKKSLKYGLEPQTSVIYIMVKILYLCHKNKKVCKTTIQQKCMMSFQPTSGWVLTQRVNWIGRTPDGEKQEAHM